MVKKTPETMTALFLASALSGCAWLPKGDAQDSAELAQAATPTTSPSAFVDYWQTRDPAEYHQTTSALDGRKPIVPSQDIILSEKGKAPGKTGKNAETRISVVIPVQQGKTAAAAKDKPPGKAETVATHTGPVKPLKVERTSVVSNRQGKRKPTVAAKKDLWGRVRGRLVLAAVEHPRIDEQLALLKRNPGYLDLLSQRSRPFLYHIVEQIDGRGLPTDLALVPMVESAFEPMAVSPKEAAGLWQILPATGQERGLVIAEGYDGRFDIHTSTGVALDYLRYLNKRFKGDWLLALAAYNAGPRAVQEAIEANTRAEAQAAAAAAAAAKKRAAAPPVEPTTPLAGQPASAPSAVPPVAVLGAAPTPPAPTPPAATSSSTAASTSPTPAESSAMAAAPQPQSPPPSLYWRLKLPKETQDYVPRILALSRLIANPEAQGLRLPLLDNRPYLFRVDVAPEVKIADALTLAGIPSEEFFRFNPGFKPSVDPPPRAYNLLLPLGQAQTLAMSVPGARLVAARQYIVRKGETLAIIARRHGVPSEKLALWNALPVDSVLKAGQQLIVYPAS